MRTSVVSAIEGEAGVRRKIAGLGHAFACDYGAGAPVMLTRALPGLGSGF